MKHAQVIVDAARRLIGVKGSAFTTQELVKEAGIALQTFYRHFAGKDQLLLAVIEEMIAEACEAFEEGARDLPDPVARLRYYLAMTMQSLDAEGDEALGPRFITSEHWRLHQLFPDELARATQRFTDLVLRELRAAKEAGLLKPTNPERDAWFVSELVTAIYHHHAFAHTTESSSVVEESLWAFCLSALGGRA